MGYSFESDLLHDSVQVPAVRDAFQLVLANVLEHQARPRGEVLHGPGDEDLGRLGPRRRAR
jgi:hypothetical protein